MDPDGAIIGVSSFRPLGRISTFTPPALAGLGFKWASRPRDVEAIWVPFKGRNSGSGNTCTGNWLIGLAEKNNRGNKNHQQE